MKNKSKIKKFFKFEKYWKIFCKYSIFAKILINSDIKKIKKANIITQQQQDHKFFYVRITIKEQTKKINIPYQQTDELIEMRDNATTCYICQQPYTNDTNENGPVIDHNHFTGEVRGIAHNNCNLHYHQQKSKIPVIFHNLRSYDGHFIIKNIAEYNQKNGLDIKVDCIANNSEKFMSITWGNLKFIDSVQFMPDSLEKLANNLPINQKQITIKYLINRFSNKLSQEEIEGILNKGQFLYSFFDSLEKLEYQGLPEREAFFSDLTNKELNIKEYNESVNLFQKLGFKTLREWLLLYQAVDVLLLTDIWINFRDNCIQNYKLDPGHNYSCPGLSYDAMLKLSGVEMELIHDPEMYTMFEKQSRGGISTTGCIRYAKANNKYCPKYKKNRDDKYLIYVEANNLYGEALMQKLPYRKFKFIKKLENYGETFVIFYNNGDKGYVYDVDITYLEHLYDQHNGYPLAPEQLIINNEMISNYNKDAMKTLRSQEEIKIIMGNTKKLTPNLMNKKNYVCNTRNLQFYISQGMKIEKVNRIIEYNQKDFMKSYIELNTTLRQQAKNKFEKDFFKLMNNSVFGKTMENVRKRACYELISSEKSFQQQILQKLYQNIREPCTCREALKFNKIKQAKLYRNVSA